MKQIELKQSEEIATGNENMSTRFLIDYVLNTPPKDGFTLKDYRKRDRITAALESANGSLNLEDNDYKELKELVGVVKWPTRSKFIYDFLESFEG